MDERAADRLWWTSVVPVWAAALVASALVLVLGPEQPVAWLSVSLGACVVLAFGLQLATRTPAGYLARARDSLGGAVVIIGAAVLVQVLLTPLSG
ncbi:hypothetical protein ARHIZOSPH14_23530 [Agromyces rhizosphaerae]|uniref:DUF3017 domain-containing protein n=1 Tax=Agromyces rhizosphaerae TaxID=88374 RepID=A0A9W6FQ17_9MICO|nr:hypothetical protein [Agromyces rhizosphaerae]GLI28111.1 hypothetical protein ARHIZOSPH14_23530 [Agromyces rhizosphaerae]